jgi:hypothetical protein
MTDIERSPISFPVDVRRLPQKGFPLVIAPDADALAELARAHDIVSVEFFRAELLLLNWKRGGVIVTGRVRAEIVQQCVVTLEPMGAVIDEAVETIFVPDGSPLARGEVADGELFLSADGPDGPETFDGQSIDAGALAEEFFALGIDPYPRKPGAALPGNDAGDAEASPFATLRNLVRKS